MQQTEAASANTGTIRMKAAQFPRRSELLARYVASDAGVRRTAEIRADIAAGRDIEFMPITYSCGDVKCKANADYGALIWAIGFLPCGLKAVVALDMRGHREVSVLVRQPERPASEFDAVFSILKSECMGEFDDDTDITLERESVWRRPLLGFSEPVEYRRVTFTKTALRRNFINAVGRHQATVKGAARIESADDAGNDAFAAMLARRFGHVVANWNTVRKYRLIARPFDFWRRNVHHDLADCEYILALRPEDMSAAAPRDAPEYTYPRMLIASWDIETSRRDGGTEAPGATIKADAFGIEVIGIVFSFPHLTKPFLRVGISSMRCNDPQDCDLLIECASEAELVDAFVTVLERTYPDMLLSFNGAKFDWPLMRKKLLLYGKFNDVVTMMSFAKPGKDDLNVNANHEFSRYGVFRSEKLKVSAELRVDLDCVAHFDGVCDLDLSVTLRQLFPKAQVTTIRSLDAYLDIAKLPKKVEMPIRRLMGIFERGLHLRNTPAGCHCGAPCKGACCPLAGLDEQPSEKCCVCLGRIEEFLCGMSRAVHYCVNDCCRPLDLMRKLNILIDKREICGLAHVDMFDAFYRAVGGKLHNLVGKYADKMGIVFSSKHAERDSWGKFEGAMVLDPLVGLYDMEPIGALDFGSLYPNSMRTENLSPDCVILRREVAEALARQGYRVKRFDADDTGTAECWVIQHNGVFIDIGNPAAPRNIVTSYDRDTYKPNYGRDALKYEHAGVFATVVQSLLAMRGPVKAKFGELTKLIEGMHARGETVAEYAGEKMDIEQLSMLRDYVNAKQLAIKIVVNSLYGVSGEPGGVLYMREVAANVTAFGRKCLCHARGVVNNSGFKVLYGDTDSLYIKATPEMVAPIYALHGIGPDRKPISGLPMCEVELAERRTHVAEDLIKFMYRKLFELKAVIRREFLDFSGSPFLIMEVEEVCFPFCLCGKKKYFAMQHKEQAVFDVAKNPLFIRGIDSVKQNQCAMVKQMAMEFMTLAVDVRADKIDICELACRVLSDQRFRTMPLEMYETFATFKAAKNNVPVQCYVKRMAERRREAEAVGAAVLPYVPADGDKFSFISCKVDELQFYDKAWRKIGAKVGDRMMPLDDVRSGAQRVDVDYYIERAIGVIARIISSNFANASDAPPTSKEEHKKQDDARVRAAKAYLKARLFPHAAEERSRVNAIAKHERSKLAAAQKAVRTSGKLGACPAGLYLDDATLRFSLEAEFLRVYDSAKLDAIKTAGAFVTAGVSVWNLNTPKGQMPRILREMRAFVTQEIAGADAARVSLLSRADMLEHDFAEIREFFGMAVYGGKMPDEAHPSAPKIDGLWREISAQAFRKALAVARRDAIDTAIAKMQGADKIRDPRDMAREAMSMALASKRN